MKRRTFLVGLGVFAGAQLALPKLPVVFDMNPRGVVVPTWQHIDPLTVYPRFDDVGLTEVTLNEYGSFTRITDHVFTRAELEEAQRLFQIQVSALRAQQDELGWVRWQARLDEHFRGAP